MSEKITGVVIDIPTIINNAKLRLYISDKFRRGGLDMLSTATEVILREPRPNGWISVKERMPELNTPVLCFSIESYSDTYGPDYSVCELLPDGRFREVTGEGYSCYSVTYWMPLPEPPEIERIKLPDPTESCDHVYAASFDSEGFCICSNCGARYKHP